MREWWDVLLLHTSFVLGVCVDCTISTSSLALSACVCEVHFHIAVAVLKDFQVCTMQLGLAG